MKKQYHRNLTESLSSHDSVMLYGYLKFNCIYLRSQQVLDTKDTRGVLGFIKENMTRIQWYVDLIECAFFSNLFGLTIPMTFILVHLMKNMMPC